MFAHRTSAAGLAILFVLTPWVAGDRLAAADAAVAGSTRPAPSASPRQDQERDATAVPPAPRRIALHFTAPTGTPGSDSSRVAGHLPSSVRSYEFLQVDLSGHSTVLRGYADSVGGAILRPHARGTRETVWLEPTEREQAKTIFVLSRGWNGVPSARSNGVRIAAVVPEARAGSQLPPGRISLTVPPVAHPPARSGLAALEMVMRYYGAGSGRVRAACSGSVRASSIRDLAMAARRAGYSANVLTLTPDSLIALVVSRVPPIVLYRSGPDAPAAARFGVVTGWDSALGTFTVREGGTQVRVVAREDLAREWRTAGSQALVVRRGVALDAGSPTGP